MISESEISVVGRIVKPHGINGEVTATFEPSVDIDALRCIVLDIDGIYVPFFVKSYRARGSEAILLTIDGISDENMAADICGLDIYALDSDLGENGENDDNDGFYMSDLIGFDLLDQDNNKIGKITGYDDSTANSLLIVEKADGDTIYIPVADELIEGFDAENKTISINLPEGLLDL